LVEHRVAFDFEVEFANGGGLQGQDFRLDIDGADIDDQTLASLIVADLRLLMVANVRILNKRIIMERHKRVSRPTDNRKSAVIDLSHGIRDGMTTLPGLPPPVIGTHLSRAESRAHYAEGVEFHIGTVEMVANTGTYLDVPFHRFPDGLDLADMPASRCVGLKGRVVRAGSDRAIDVDLLSDVDVWQRAVLFHTGWDRHFGTEAYAVDAPYLTEATVQRLVDARATLVGIDSLNVDATDRNIRPAHTLLLAAGIPILEHLTGLDQLPDEGFELTALAPRVVGLGTFPVRAVARLTT
jgi:arylformamidase